METTIKPFTGKAAIYSKYRPNYPEEYIDYLISFNKLTPNSRIADIGAGTGILTEQLVARGFKVWAVEPNFDMRTLAEKSLKSHPNFTSLPGTAEETNIENASMDLITVGQAFHWFVKDKFKRECQRILKANSNVAVVWNSRDSSSPLVKENAEICKRFCPAFKGFSKNMDETPHLYKEFFRAGKYEYEIFRHDLQYHQEAFVGRNLSSSYAPKPTEENYSQFVEAIVGLFQKYSKKGMLVVSNLTRSYIGQV